MYSSSVTSFGFLNHMALTSLRSSHSYVVSFTVFVLGFFSASSSSDFSASSSPSSEELLSAIYHKKKWWETTEGNLLWHRNWQNHLISCIKVHTWFLLVTWFVIICRNLYINLLACPEVNREVDKFGVSLHQILHKKKMNKTVRYQDHKESTAMIVLGTAIEVGMISYFRSGRGGLIIMPLISDMKKYLGWKTNCSCCNNSCSFC